MFTRREFLLSSLAATGGLCLGAGADDAPARPNIVFIYTDDQAYWTINGLGYPNASTSNLDRLLREGVHCTNAFVTTPVCSPSRLGLIGSRYGSEMGITDWINPREEPDLGLDPATPTWVRQLRDSGYRTGLVGKWHLGTQDKYHPSVFGYDYFAGFREGGAKVENPVLELDGEEREVPGQTVDLLTDLGLEFIRDAREPFMLSLHYRAPHAPWKPVAESDEAAYSDRELKLPNPDYPELDHERVDSMTREYLASVTSVDRNVGRVLNLLDEMGIAEETIVVFTSDHGYNIGHHGIKHKGNGSWITKPSRELAANSRENARPNMFDTSLRVPLLVRWPKELESGKVVENTITNLDWYPTLLAFAGLQPEEGVRLRGSNFLPLLQGEETAWNDNFHGEYSQHHYVQADLRMYRTPEWKLVRDFRNLDKEELYHLAEDPEETLNLIHSPKGWAVYEQLNEQLLAAMESIGDEVLARAK